jgi:hypothetical protein
MPGPAHGRDLGEVMARDDGEAGAAVRADGAVAGGPLVRVVELVHGSDGVSGGQEAADGGVVRPHPQLLQEVDIVLALLDQPACRAYEGAGWSMRERGGA